MDNVDSVITCATLSIKKAVPYITERLFYQIGLPKIYGLVSV